MSRTRRILLASGVLALGLAGLVVFRPGAPEPPAPGLPSSDPPSSGQEVTVTVEAVREAVVAGAFYPSDAAELQRMVDGYLGQVKGETTAGLRALVCPHAGYVYSGLTAAHCYAQVAKSAFDTVVILAPSHRHAFEGVSIPAVDAYRTPLGLVLLAPVAKEYAAGAPFVSVADAHSREHSLEVQLPFVQRTLKSARIVPMVFGRVSTDAVARALARRLDERTLIVASSDLSHHHPYETARELDQRAVDAMVSLDLERMRGQHACGKGPILALMALAKQQGWKAKLLDYRNSGDTAGSKNSVVGYSAIAFYSTTAADGSHG
jgi:AmmeMemoRadiSam system protein B